MNILLLEDLDSYAADIVSALQAKKFELGRVEVERVATEYEFRRRLPELAARNFDVAVFDVMVSWCQLEDFQDPKAKELPLEVQEEQAGTTKWRGGVRCYQLFLDARTSQARRVTPSIFYSILDGDDLRETLPEGVELVTKQGEIEPLVQAILKATKRK
jgi:hypothetical protein